MDIGTIVGLVLGIGLVLGSIAMGGGMGAFFNIPSLMITVGGSISAVLINFPLNSCMGVFSVVKNCFTHKLPTPGAIIQQFKELAAASRQNGFMALEEKLTEFDDPFMVRVYELPRRPS